MKKLKLLFVFLLLSAFNPVFAGEIDYFEVTLWSESAVVGEALDLTISAMDKDNNIVDDYLGTILVFSETDPKAELPNVLNESSYTFTLADAGSVKFENAVIFNSSGNQDLHVYDLNDDTDSVAGIVEIEVSKNDTGMQSEEITISSPENSSTLTSSTIQVAGKTASNHRVIVVSNGSEYETISNTDWIFELSVDNQKDGDISLRAKVLNADDETIWESDVVNVRLSASAPTIVWFQATPAKGNPGYPFTVELISEKWLENVELTLNDSITVLKENEDGKYTGEFIAPTQVGKYSINVMLQNDLWVKSNNPGISNIEVLEKEEIPELKSAEKNDPIPSVEKEIVKPDLTVTGLKLTKLKTQSVLEWDKIEDATHYDVYMKEWNEFIFLEKVSDPRITIYITWDEIKYNDFAIEAVIENFQDTTDLKWDISEAVKVQTGPEKYLFIILLAFFLASIIWMSKFIYRR